MHSSLAGSILRRVPLLLAANCLEWLGFFTLPRHNIPMAKEGISNNPDAWFEYDNFSPKIQEAIDSLTQRLLERHPIDHARTANFFRVPQIAIEAKHIEYFASYTKLAFRQLIIGGFYGPHSNLASLSEDEQVEAIQGEHAQRVFFDVKIFHDLAHTIVALGKSGAPEALTSLTPDFQRKSQRLADYPSAAERDAAVNDMMLDERLVSFWSQFVTDRSTIISDIRFAKNKNRNEDGSVNLEKAEEEFIFRYLDHNTSNSFANELVGRFFREYETNEMLTFDVFVEITKPLMKREAPKAARLF